MGEREEAFLEKGGGVPRFLLSFPKPHPLLFQRCYYDRKAFPVLGKAFLS